MIVLTPVLKPPISVNFCSVQFCVSVNFFLCFRELLSVFPFSSAYPRICWVSCEVSTGVDVQVAGENTAENRSGQTYLAPGEYVA